MSIGALAPLILFVAVIQLIVQPVYLTQGAQLLALPRVQIDSLLLQGAAPVATLPAIFCRQYDCDGQFAAALILATTLLALGSIPLMAIWLG